MGKTPRQKNPAERIWPCQVCTSGAQVQGARRWSGAEMLYETPSLGPLGPDYTAMPGFLTSTIGSASQRSQRSNVSQPWWSCVHGVDWCLVRVECFESSRELSRGGHGGSWTGLSGLGGDGSGNMRSLTRLGRAAWLQDAGR